MNINEIAKTTIDATIYKLYKETNKFRAKATKEQQQKALMLYKKAYRHDINMYQDKYKAFNNYTYNNNCYDNVR